MMRVSSWLPGFLVVVLSGLTVPADDEPGAPDVPKAFAPLEGMVGGWKGQGVNPKNRIKGWKEKHMWSWKFAQGKPVGLAVEVADGKILTKGQLSSDAKTDIYRLDATDPSGKPVRFSGKYDSEIGVLSLSREKPPIAIGQERLDIAIDSSKIRYTMRLFRQEPGAPQFALVTDASLTKEGESFAAGGASADLPKCIVTGGAGSMTVSYEGKSYTICCSGCRDEFNESPAKYVAKALAKARDGVPATVTTAATPVAKAETAEPKKMDVPKESPRKTDSEQPSEKQKTEGSANANKAASIFSQGQSLEKAGKKQAAVIYYKRILKEYPDTPSAKTAKDRIKALGG